MREVDNAAATRVAQRFAALVAALAAVLIVLALLS
jgi:hypothetical protein